MIKAEAFSKGKSKKEKLKPIRYFSNDKKGYESVYGVYGDVVHRWSFYTDSVTPSSMSAKELRGERFIKPVTALSIDIKIKNKLRESFGLKLLKN